MAHLSTHFMEVVREEGFFYKYTFLGQDLEPEVEFIEVFQHEKDKDFYYLNDVGDQINTDEPDSDIWYSKPEQPDVSGFMALYGEK